MKLKAIRKPKSGQSLLLYFLWRKHGGARAVSRKLDLPYYAAGNWAHDGQVPVKFIPLVKQVLKVSIWGLNYKQAKVMKRGEKIPTWAEVAKLYNLTDEQVKLIIKHGEPR